MLLWHGLYSQSKTTRSCCNTAPPEPGQPGNNNAKTSRGGSQRQYASAHPEATVYTGPQSPRKAVTLRTLRAKYEKGQPISMVTAYDYPSAVHVSCCAQLGRWTVQCTLANVHSAAPHLPPLYLVERGQQHPQRNRAQAMRHGSRSAS